MKVEMGESIVYSWFRHIKRCQIVQTNWKPSPRWELLHENQLQEMMRKTDTYFQTQYAYTIYKKRLLFHSF